MIRGAVVLLRKAYPKYFPVMLSMVILIMPVALSMFSGNSCPDNCGVYLPTTLFRASIVITSYSIHYTKLYEVCPQRCAAITNSFPNSPEPSNIIFFCIPFFDLFLKGTKLKFSSISVPAKKNEVACIASQIPLFSTQIA